MVVADHDEHRHLNPVAEIARIAHRHGALVAVDAVSSIGAGDDHGRGLGHRRARRIGRGKALSAMPGAGIVAITRQALERSAATSRRAGYLDLHAHCRALADLAQTPNTPAVQVFVSLHAALRGARRAGDRASRDAIRDRAAFTRGRLRHLGLTFADHGASSTSNVLTCVWQPDGVLFASLAGRLKERGIVVYNGKGALTDRMFQIGHIGALRRGDTRDAMRAVAAIVRDGAGGPRRGRRESARAVA